MAIERLSFLMKQDLMIRASEHAAQSTRLLKEGKPDKAIAHLDKSKLIIMNAKDIDMITAQYILKLSALGVEQPSVEVINVPTSTIPIDEFPMHNGETIDMALIKQGGGKNVRSQRSRDNANKKRRIPTILFDEFNRFSPRVVAAEYGFDTHRVMFHLWELEAEHPEIFRKRKRTHYLNPEGERLLRERLDSLHVPEGFFILPINQLVAEVGEGKRSRVYRVLRRSEKNWPDLIKKSDGAWKWFVTQEGLQRLQELFGNVTHEGFHNLSIRTLMREFGFKTPTPIYTQIHKLLEQQSELITKNKSGGREVFAATDEGLAALREMLANLAKSQPASISNPNEERIKTEFTRRENALFQALLSSNGALSGREQLKAAVWPNVKEPVLEWTLDTLVGRLRKKLKRQGQRYEIETIKTRGFKLAEAHGFRG